jgi:DNA ligase-associated metallophosphoesterase
VTDCSIEVAGETLLLMPERAVSWAREKTLFITDTHFGKAAAFRASGVAIPDVETDDLYRLGAALQRTGAERIIHLGDLFHALEWRDEHVYQLLGEWRSAHQGLSILLVRGNHDQHAGDPPSDWMIECVNEPFALPPFALRHYPYSSMSGYTLAGHLHPAVRLAKGKDTLKLPSFVFGEDVAILPAFGSFIDSATFASANGDQCFLIADGAVIAV